jgi:hypothetical protein
MWSRIFVAAVLISVVTASFARATVMNVDLNQGASATYSALGAAPDSGGNTFWNGLNLVNAASFTTPANSLKYSDGTTTATGVSFSLGNTFNAGQISQGFVAPAILPLFIDYAYNATNTITTTATFSINGLNPLAVYKLYIYSMADYGGSGGNTSFTIDGITGSTLLTGNPKSVASGGDGIGSGFFQATTGVSSGTNNGNYALYSNLTAAGGTISGTFTGSNVRFNGFQLITEVPEPSSLALAGFATIGLMIRARRSRTR